MSSRITKARLTQVVSGTVAAVAIATAATVGLTGVPHQQAAAATFAAGSTAARHAQFGKVVAATVPGSARKRLMAPKVRRVVMRRLNVSTARALGMGPWKQAKVSWYGPGFYGNTMAGGGKLRRNSMVVAHKSMKFGTRILFTYRGRSVVAVVRDRGPYVSGRVFDLGPGTARALGFQGVGTVKYRVIK